MVMVMLVFVMLMAVIVRMLVVRLRREVDVKFHTGDGGFLLARDVEVIAVELELFQFAFELARIHAEVDQRGDEHVASDAAEDVEIKDFHCRRETFNLQHRMASPKQPLVVRYSMLDVGCFLVIHFSAKALIWLAA